MTSSGTYSFNLSNGELVFGAYERVGVRAPSLRQEHWSTARRELNLLNVELSNRQVNLFKVELASISLVAGTDTYDVPAKTVMILDAYISLNNGQSDQTDRYVTPLSRTQYASLANKQDQGAPTQFWFDRLISPTVTMWPVPDTGGPYTFNYYACLQQQDANMTGGETPDVPYLWLDVMVSGLAYRLSRIYARELTQQCKSEYDEAWTFAAEQGTENVPTQISPNLGSYYKRS